MAFVSFERGIRYETAEHGFSIGESVKLFDGGRWFYGRIVGFESFEGSGLCFVDAMLRVEGPSWPYGHAVASGAVKRV